MRLCPRWVIYGTFRCLVTHYRRCRSPLQGPRTNVQADLPTRLTPVHSITPLKCCTMQWSDAAKPVAAVAVVAALYKLAVSAAEGALRAGSGVAEAAGVQATTTSGGVMQRLRVVKWLLGFSALQSAALARLAGRRLLGTQRHHTRNALPAKVDLLVTLLKTGIVGAPPSVATIRRYVAAFFLRSAQGCRRVAAHVTCSLDLCAGTLAAAWVVCAFPGTSQL